MPTSKSLSLLCRHPRSTTCKPHALLRLLWGFACCVRNSSTHMAVLLRALVCAGCASDASCADQAKVEALMRSIQEIGLQEPVSGDSRFCRSSSSSSVDRLGVSAAAVVASMVLEECCSSSNVGGQAPCSQASARDSKCSAARDSAQQLVAYADAAVPLSLPCLLPLLLVARHRLMYCRLMGSTMASQAAIGLRHTNGWASPPSGAECGRRTSRS